LFLKNFKAAQVEIYRFLFQEPMQVRSQWDPLETAFWLVLKKLQSGASRNLPLSLSGTHAGTIPWKRPSGLFLKNFKAAQVEIYRFLFQEPTQERSPGNGLLACS